MTRVSRRSALGGLLFGMTATAWPRGIEGQRRADLGDGTFLNPVLAGDRPDPSLIRDGGSYFMTFSSFDAYPGLQIWRSEDLINWQPRAPVLSTNVGSVWAPELVKHADRYYIYFHARTSEQRSVYVVHAADIDGPWSEPIDLGLAHIDPGHAVGEDGRRYLFLSGGDRVRLSADGLRIDSAIEHVYDGWRYPEEWVVESFSQEGPKILRHGGFFYMTLAEGGTAGPPTGHMVVVARSRSIHGPWENSPYNPVVRTRSVSERWWSRGHATLIKGPDARWWMMYHGYENGFYTLGRQALLEPIVWTADGWFQAMGGDLAQPLAKPSATVARPHGMPLSDDFNSDRLSNQWSFHAPNRNESDRIRVGGGALLLRGKGSAPSDCSPLTFVAGDHAYRVEVEIEVDNSVCAGLLLFYSERLYAGLGFNAREFVMHRYGLERALAKPTDIGSRLWLRLTNDRHIVTLHHSTDARRWTKFDVQMEVSGYHHNVMGGFHSLRPALYAAGRGRARFRRLRYEALP